MQGIKRIYEKVNQTDPELIQMLELADKHILKVIIIVSHMFKKLSNIRTKLNF